MQQSPNDAKFFELITPIATFLTGILSGIMLGKQEKPEIPEAPKAPEPTLGDVTPADLVPEPVAEVAPLVVAAAAGAAVVAAADDDEDTIA
jgi:hypothetical protein